MLTKKMKGLFYLLLFLLITVVFLFSFLSNQGLQQKDWNQYSKAKVVIDELGIPTITASNWQALINAQGYVVASDRLWQMDLGRRAASGRLSEWFGERALEHDINRRSENWQEVARLAVERLPESQRVYCDAYATGVNEFIQDHPHKIGIEYKILRVSPEPWSCQDSLLMLMNMIYDLTAFADREAVADAWRRSLDQDWYRFLFPSGHPWNHPMFGPPAGDFPFLPPINKFLPYQKIEDKQLGHNTLIKPELNHEPSAIGSNNWAYRGEKGYFVANDPHLNYRIPQTWYPMRLKVSRTDWVVGSALAGIPGVILGANPHLAWAFTNVGEDIQDFLEEELNSDMTQYVVRIEGGKKIWGSVNTVKHSIKVKDAATKVIEAKYTHRGPLAKREHLAKDKYYSNQWLAFNPEMLRLPSIDLDRSKSWEEVNLAIDGMRLPAQNVLVMDRSGGFGYRMSGTGIVRAVAGNLPQLATSGEWLGFQPPSKRLRVWYPPDKAQGLKYLATANERIWIDKYDHYFFADERKARITEVLSKSPQYTREDMERLQVDTVSKKYALFLRWLVKNSTLTQHRSLFNKWSAWDGNALGHAEIFTQAIHGYDLLINQLMSRIRQRFLSQEQQDLPYEYRLQSAWSIAILDSRNASFQAFGFKDDELANYLVIKILEKLQNSKELYFESNRWAAQHPFAKRIPIIGGLFAVKEYPQYGYSGVVRVEKPNLGASFRAVWDLSNLRDSTWIFPVGQSGHIGSKFYKNYQKLWFSDQRAKVFENPEEFGL